MRSAPALRTFMEYHVFAVWDFMSLLKALQQRLSCVSVPWLPNASSLGSRLVNEIVLGEETDVDEGGGFASHFELYHRAMTCFGASTHGIDRFLDLLRTGKPVGRAIRSVELPEAIQGFVTHTFNTIDSGDLCAVASAFTFGREDLLPDVFQKIVAELDAEVDGKLGPFEYYLRRHIALDADEHGPMATRLIENLCGTDPVKWQRAEQAAAEALQARIALWNAIHEACGRHVCG